jgi:Tfp pilus assembly protein FimT
MELLLVLVILVLVGATAWPMLDRSLADQRLRDAADLVRGEWSRARAQAMASGVACQFRYTPEDRTYWVEPCDIYEAATEQTPDTMQLPEEVTFVKSSTTKEGEETTPSEKGPTAASADGSPGTADDSAVETIVFMPDGTCSSAEVTLRNEYDRGVVVSINGLTAIAAVGEVFKIGEELR